MVKLLVAGGAGFIGSCFVRQSLARADESITVLDSLTYAGNLENLESVASDARYRFVRGSICDPAAVEEAAADCEAVVNFAAETHVDRSIDDPALFLSTNIEGPRVLMDHARRHGLRYVQVSTDEVYGSLGPEGLFTETSPLDPSSPYAASKTSADLLVSAYARTYGLDAVITRCGNNYGPYQFPEKLIPLFVTNALDDKELPLYGDGLHVRDWIHVEDHCEAIRVVLERGQSGEVYNISAAGERNNREVCARILEVLAKPESLVRYVTDRPGHDRRYALDSNKLRSALGWAPRTGFEEGLRSTIDWYESNRSWWERVKSGAYRDYYDRMYGHRLGSRSAESGAESTRGGSDE
jgi:dTDP-glucose 4,6-dehydratase